MNQRDFNRIVKDHLLPELPGYVTSKRGDLFAVPMNHLWRGFVFESSASRELCYFNVNIMPLYKPTDFLYAGIGRRLRSRRMQAWEWGEASEEATVKELIGAMKSAKQELLDKFQTPSDIAELGPQTLNVETWHALDLLGLAQVYAGRYEEATRTLENLHNRMELQRAALKEEEKSEMHLRCETILNLLKTEPSRAKALLLEWEQQTIKNLKLDRFPQ